MKSKARVVVIGGGVVGVSTLYQLAKSKARIKISKKMVFIK